MRIARLSLGLVGALLVAALLAPVVGRADPPDPGRIRLAPLGDGPRRALIPETGATALSRSSPASLSTGAAVLRALDPPRVRAGALDAHARRTLDTLRGRADGPVELRMRSGRKTVRSLRAAALERAFRGDRRGRTRDERAARRFLRRSKALLRLADPDAELAPTRARRDRWGRRHVRFAQRHGALPVWPADVIVHLDAAGNVEGLTGDYIATPRGLDREPSVALEAAIERAVAHVGGDAETPVTSHGLIVHASDDGVARLAWKLEVEVSFASHWQVAVDAMNGDVLRAASQVMTMDTAGSGLDLFSVNRAIRVYENGGLYQSVDASKQMFDPNLADPPAWSNDSGFIRILDAMDVVQGPTDPIPPLFDIQRVAPTGWAPPAAVSAAYALSEVYDYYLSDHAWDSFDGDGSSIYGIVRIGLDNAYWHGGVNAMGFGNARPYAGAIDVVGHEVSHGVIQETANLLYQNQSGAANEAFADILGEMVENRTLVGNDWLLGTQLGVIFRSLSDPGSLQFAPGRPYPERMSEFIPPTDPIAAADNGGVHLNSSIVNHAFYQLAEGLPNAIGVADAAAIFFDALQNLTSTAQFLDVRLAAVAAAGPFGAGHVTATEDAFDFVEIFDGGVVTDPNGVPPVVGPDATFFTARNGFAGPRLLAREETGAPNFDPAGGVFVAPSVPAEATKLSVTGNGQEVWFIDPATRDACTILTDTTGGVIGSCVSGALFGGYASVEIAPDGNTVALTPFTDTVNAPLNSVLLLDTTSLLFTVFPLLAPVLEGGEIPSIQFADIMHFTLDSSVLVFDAFNQVALPAGGTLEAWSIYALEVDTGFLQTIVAPVQGVDTGFPSLAQTTDNAITFDLSDPNTFDSIILAGSLVTGSLNAIGSVLGGPGIPSYLGDDSAIIHSQANGAVPTGSDLVRQGVLADRITPTGGPTLWIADADTGVVYRRGTFTPPAPDADGDGVPDASDNCPNEPNPGQGDTGTVGGPGADLIGDACQCGDGDDDGQVTGSDAGALQNELAHAPGGLSALQKCSVRGSVECDILDWVVIQRRLGAGAPNLDQVCSAAAI